MVEKVCEEFSGECSNDCPQYGSDECEDFQSCPRRLAWCSERRRFGAMLRRIETLPLPTG